jgi:hypothetical protein
VVRIAAYLTGVTRRNVFTGEPCRRGVPKIQDISSGMRQFIENNPKFRFDIVCTRWGKAI